MSYISCHLLLVHYRQLLVIQLRIQPLQESHGACVQDLPTNCIAAEFMQ